MKRNVVAVVVGGDAKCARLLSLTRGNPLSNIQLEILGVQDLRPDSPGMVKARSMGMFTTVSLEELLSISGINKAIVLTKDQEVLKEVHRLKGEGVKIIDSEGADILLEHCLLYEFLKTVINAIPTGILILNPPPLISWSNETLRKITGYSEEELMGRSIQGMFEEDEEYNRALESFALGGKDSPMVTARFRKKDGGIIHSILSARPLYPLEGLAVVVMDITEQKAMEDKLIHTEKMRALGTMAGSFAHKINNVLAVILGNAQLLSGETAGGFLQGHIKKIVEAATSGAKLIHQFQRFTKTERAPKGLKPVDLKKVIAEVIEATRPRWEEEARRDGITITASLNGEAGCLVMGDEDQLKEAFTNLIFNSIDAMPQGGAINVNIEPSPDGEYLRIKVTDQGEGMNEEVKRRAPEPFFTTRGVHRVGLGLSTSFSIVKQHGGDLEIISSPQMGTTILLKLPRYQGELQPQEELPAVKPVRPRECRILLVEDDESVRTVLGLILQRGGHRVTLAADGQEGLERFNEGPFDLVLTDLGMPKMDGLEMARRIKAKSSATPICLITGWGDLVDEETVALSGVRYFLKKPVDMHQVLSMVQTALENPS